MFALIRKDFIAGRFFLAGVLAIYLLYALSASRSPIGFFFLNIGVTMFLAVGPLILDEYHRIDTLVCFLPPSRGQVVLARYAMALCALILGLSLQYGLGAVFSRYLERTGFGTLCAPQLVLLFCLVPITCTALYLPCCFRFGLPRGSLVFLVLTIALVTLLTSPLVAIELFAADSGLQLTRQMMEYPEDALLSLVDHVAARFGQVRFYITVCLSGVTLVPISIALSVRSLRIREF
jgi:hypothetical protein